MDRIKEIPRDLRQQLQVGTARFREQMMRAFTDQGDGPPAYHLVPREDAWAVVGRGENKAVELAETKEQALSIGRGIGRDQGAILVVHREDGTIQEILNYRRDV